MLAVNYIKTWAAPDVAEADPTLKHKSTWRVAVQHTFHLTEEEQEAALEGSEDNGANGKGAHSAHAMPAVEAMPAPPEDVEARV